MCRDCTDCLIIGPGGEWTEINRGLLLEWSLQKVVYPDVCSDR